MSNVYRRTKAALALRRESQECRAPPSCFRAQVERAVGDAADEMAAPVGCEIPRLSHAACYSITQATPPLPTPPKGSDPVP